MLDNSDSEWMNDAACKMGSGVDPELFFPQHDRVESVHAITRPSKRRNPTTPGAAKLVCKPCPVKLACLKFALDHGFCGVWGGMSERERRMKFSANPVHGTLRCFYGGCRCSPCVQAHSDEYEIRRQRRNGLVECPPNRHGTETGYHGYRCRCAPCVTAHEATLKTGKGRR